MSEERDTELENLLSGIRGMAPTEAQMQSWRRAVQEELRKSPLPIPRRRFAWAGQLAAALATGFLLGALSMKHAAYDSQKSEPVATIQYTFDKSE